MSTPPTKTWRATAIRRLRDGSLRPLPAAWHGGGLGVDAGEEGWPSGRRRSTRNRLGAQKVPRGFESLSLRYHFRHRVTRRRPLPAVIRVDEVRRRGARAG